MDTTDRRFQLIERPPEADEPAEPRKEYQKARIRINKGKFDQLLRRRGMVNGRGPHKGMTHQGMFERATSISNKVAWKWLRDPGAVEYVSFSVLARICQALQCQPGDILEFVPGDDLKEYRRPVPMAHYDADTPEEWK